MDAFSADIAKPVFSWLPPGCETLLGALSYFHAAGFSRYVPRSGMTFCNFFTREVMRALDAELPEGMTANQMHDWLLTPDARQAGWEAAGQEVAQANADNGKPCIAVWKNAQGHGHITPLAPSLGQPGIWVSHVGSTMFLRCDLAHAFGAAQPMFYVHQ